MQDKISEPSPEHSNQRGPFNGATDAADRTLEQAIGFQVRHQRKLSNLTVSDLAQAAQISPGMLSKIENGQISPSLSTLQTLAAALNIPFTLLFANFEQPRDCSYVKSGEGSLVRRRGTDGPGYQLVGYPIEGPLVAEPYVITLNRDALPHAELRREGVGLVYMLSGKIDYAYGDRSYQLSAGDTLTFNSAAPHGPSQLYASPASYLSVSIYQRR